MENIKELDLDSLKFTLIAFKKIKNVQKSISKNSVELKDSSFSIKEPESTVATPKYELMKKNSSKHWVLFTYGKVSCKFNEDLLENLCNLLYITDTNV